MEARRPRPTAQGITSTGNETTVTLAISMQTSNQARRQRQIRPEWAEWDRSSSGITCG